MTRVPRGLAAALVLALALAAAACGDDDDEDPAASATASASAPATSDAAATSEPAEATSAAAPETTAEEAPSDATSAASEATSAAADTFTAEEVVAASDPWACEPVYAVPRDAAGTKLAFINPGPADPYVEAWSNGMQAAADFYGVDFKEGFLGGYDFSKVVDTYRTLSSFEPDVVGAHVDDASGKALATAAEAEGDPLLYLAAVVDDIPWIGMENLGGGRVAGEELQKAVEPLLDGAWAGKKIVVVGVTAEGCVPCDERVDGAFEVLQQFLPEGDNVEYIRMVEKTATTDVIQNRMRDVITANPDANFVIATLDDPSGAGAFNAVRQAGIEDRARIASIGGDNLAITNLLEGSESYVASIDAKPFCEGWAWVEAALAVHAGAEFAPYPFTSIITPANVESYRWRLETG